MAQRASERYAAAQSLARMMDADGIRWAGTWGSPYPKAPIVRYHAVLEVTTMPNHQYGWQKAEYDQKIAQHGVKAERHGWSEPPLTFTYADMACGIANLQVGRRKDVRELTDPGQERATDAPICKSCQRIINEAEAVRAASLSS